MRAFIAVAVTVVAMLGAGQASASSGEFTRTWADESWSKGSIAGSANWTDCQAGFSCSWLATVTAQPSLPVYRCLGDEAIDSDPNTEVVWTSNQTSNTSVTFDLQQASILRGVQGQRVCLSVIYGFWQRDPICVAQAPILGQDPLVVCPFEEFLAAKVLASKFLEVEPPLPAPPPDPAPTAVPPTTTKPKPVRRKCPKGKRKVRRNGKVRCIKRHRPRQQR